MADILFIVPNDLKRLTVVNGSVDADSFVQYVQIAQDIHLETYLGTSLFEKLKDLIRDNEIGLTENIDYLNLLTNYVKQVTIHWAMVEYLPYAAYTVSNQGVYKHSSETSETVDKGEVDFLLEKQRQTAQHYTRRMIDFLCANQTLYPEYFQSQNNGDVSPNQDTGFMGWEI